MELQAACVMTVLLICGDGMPQLQQKKIVLTKETLCSVKVWHLACYSETVTC